MNNKTPSLWLSANFIKLWLGSAVSAFADSGYFILLNWFVISTTRSEVVLGATLALASVPRLIFMIAGGVLADRMNRKTILVYSLLARATILLILTGTLLYNGMHLHPWLIYTVAIVFGTVDAFFWPASGSITPQVVEKSSLGVANGLVQTTQQVSTILGPLAAAALLWIGDYRWMFALVALLYFIGAGILATLRLHAKVDGSASSSVSDSDLSLGLQGSGDGGRREEVGEQRHAFWREIMASFRYVRSVRILVFIMVISLFLNFAFMGPINVGLPVFVQQMHWAGSTYGAFEAMFSAGAIGGGLIVVMLNGFRGRIRWLPYVGIGMGAAMSTLSTVGFSWEGGLALATMGMTVAIVDIPVLTYVQTIVPDEQLGRVMSLLNTMSIGLQPLSYAVCSLLLSRHILHPQSLFFTCGLLILGLMSLAAVPSDFRRAEENPLWQAAGGRRTNSQRADVDSVNSASAT